MQRINTVGEMIEVLKKYPNNKRLIFEVYLTAGWDGVHYDAVETTELENDYDIWDAGTHLRIGANEI